MAVQQTSQSEREIAALHERVAELEERLADAEAARTESEQRFRLLVDLSPDGIFVETERGEVLEANPAARRIFGYDEGEMIGLSIGECVTEELTRELPDVITEDFITGITPVEQLNRRRDGTFFPAEILTRSFDVGDERKLLVFVRDIEGSQSSRRGGPRQRDPAPCPPRRFAGPRLPAQPGRDVSRRPRQ